MPRLNVQIDGLDTLQGNIEDALPSETTLNEVAATAIAAYTLQHYEAESDPYGRRWTPNAALTIALKGHDTVMVNTGATRDSIRVVKNNKSASVFVGDSKQDLRVHQYGEGRIPQRQILYDEKLGPVPTQYTEAIDKEIKRLV